MALSGSLSSSSYSNRNIIFEWTATQSEANNTSKISWTLKGGGSASGYYKAGNFKVVIAGSTVYSTSSDNRIELRNGTTVASGSKTLTHNSDGTKSFSVSIQAGIYTYDVNCTGSTTFTLDKIARSTVPVLDSTSAYIGDVVKFTLTRASTKYTHDLKWKIGSSSGTITTGVGTSYSWTIPSSFASKITSGTSATCTVTCITMNGSEKIGSNTVNLTVKVPNNDTYKPTVSATLEEAVSAVKNAGTGYLRTVSKIKFTITATAKDGATIKTYSTTVNGTTYSGSSFTTGTLQTAGSNTATIKVTDSRGRSATITKTFTVTDYSKPKISTFKVVRATSTGTADENGSYGKITIKASVSDVTSNTASYKLYRKLVDATSWTQLTFSSSDLSVNTSTTVSGFSADNDYELKLSVTDKFNTTTKTISLGSTYSLIDFNASGKGMAIGKVSEYTDQLEINMPIRMLKHAYIEYETETYNANSLQTSGDWYLSSSSTNTPSDNGGWLTVKSNSAKTYIYQEFVSVLGTKWHRYYSDGTWKAWIRERIVQYGSVDVPIATANTPASVTVTFDTPFPGTPRVVATAASTGTDKVTEVTTSGTSSTSVKIWVNRTNTTTTTVQWIAVY